MGSISESFWNLPCLLEGCGTCWWKVDIAGFMHPDPRSMDAAGGMEAAQMYSGDVCPLLQKLPSAARMEQRVDMSNERFAASSCCETSQCWEDEKCAWP